MIKRFIITTIAILTLIVGSSTVAFATGQHGTKPDDDDTDDTSDIIEKGLWAGSKFDVDGMETHKQRPDMADPKTHSKPRPSTDTTDTHKSDKSHVKDSGVPVRQSATYAALGDSVAAGLGLPRLPGNEPRCGRSASAYPDIIAESRNLQLTNIACSGATMGDLVTKQRVSGPNLPAQLDTAFAMGAPELITITAGANDTRWVNFLQKCYSSTCGTRSDMRIANTLRAALALKLRFALYDIQQRSNGDVPEVIITGYYNPLPADCVGVEPRLTADEIAWLDSEVVALNQTLANVSSEFSFVRFVPIDFSGHGICSTDPWVQTPDDPAPFHPTARGQMAIAEAVLD